MAWIYLSPHLDDVVLSCGGWVWEQIQRGEPVEIWTICAGDPPSQPLTPYAEMLHQRWQTGPEADRLRREEDAAACHSLGAHFRHFPIPDCIYRLRPETGHPLVASDADLFDPLNLPEASLVAELASLLRDGLPPQAVLVSPLTLGGHIDHRLVRQAAGQLRPDGAGLLFYADFPYVQQDPSALQQYAGGLEPVAGDISPAGLAAWQGAVAAYTSQISSFWSSLEEMRARLEAYWLQGGGRLWARCPAA